MNNILEIKKYGLYVRLVSEEDANFIVKIRTQGRVGSFLHETSSDVEQQKQWIRNYKVREAAGKEYYFIFFKDNTPVGVSRVVVLNDLYCNSGSWVCDQDASLDAVIATNFIVNDFVFENLGKVVNLFEVVKENKSVWKFHESKGAKRYAENSTHYFYTLIYDDYKIKRNKIIELLNLNQN